MLEHRFALESSTSELHTNRLVFLQGKLLVGVAARKSFSVLVSKELIWGSCTRT